MIRHAIYSDIAACKEIPKLNDNRKPLNDRSAWSDNLLAAFDADLGTRNLMDFLLRDDVRVASLTPWEPNLGPLTSDLAITNLDEVEKYSVVQSSRSLPTRRDHRLGYSIPRCSEGLINFQLLEPDLEWLGMGLLPIGKRVNISKVEWRVNGVLQALRPRKILPMLYVTWWSRIPVTVPSRMREYNVSFCNSHESTYIQMQHLVGVMRPTMSAREADLVEAFDYRKN
jgi:hypothetical protein